MDLPGSIRIYARLMGASVRSQMQYRASFLMQAAGTLAITVTEFAAMYVLFERFGNLKGWKLPEVALLYGMANVSFAFAELAGRGFDTFAGMVKSGDFDRVLLRPCPAALQVGGRELPIRRVGRAVQGAFILGWAAAACGVVWTPANALLLVAAILGGTCLFYGVFMLHATLCFWTIESLEITSIISHGGLESAQWPMDIYAPWFRRFFTIVVPLIFANYYPGLVILRPEAAVGLRAAAGWLAPLAGISFLTACTLAWRVGVRHYRSTGS